MYVYTYTYLSLSLYVYIYIYTHICPQAGKPEPPGSGTQALWSASWWCSAWSGEGSPTGATQLDPTPVVIFNQSKLDGFNVNTHCY